MKAVLCIYECICMQVYHEAVLSVPPVKEKRFVMTINLFYKHFSFPVMYVCMYAPVSLRFWRRYIYIWINFALFEELTARYVCARTYVCMYTYSTYIHNMLYVRPHATTETCQLLDRFTNDA